MLKRLSASIREYKAPTLVTLVLIVLEVVFECIIPFMTSTLVNRVKAGTTIKDILITGAILVLMAVLSLMCGGIAAVTASKASTGFAKNLRKDMFSKIQTYSFENVDKFSSSSLVTRLTTDVSNVQMAYMMINRIAIRCPLMLVFAIFMAWKMGGSLAATFVFAVPVMAFGLILIAKTAMPAFKRVFKKYDKLNESIEENVRAMRVVKGFAREEYEKEKFGNAAEEICKDFTKADRIVAGTYLCAAAMTNGEIILNDMEYLGVEYDNTINYHAPRGENCVISTSNSKVKVVIIPTNEELVIARETKKLVK